MAARIRNDVQYGIARWWLEEFEQALLRMNRTERVDSQADPKLQQRLNDFQREQANRLREEIRELRAEIEGYEGRSQGTDSVTQQFTNRDGLKSE